MRYLTLYLIAALLTFYSCNSYRKQTFLDFEFGMTYNEYLMHAKNLEKSGFITKLDGREFDYSIKIGDSNYVVFHFKAYVYSNARLTMLEGHLASNLSDAEKKQLYEVLALKHGQPSEPFAKNQENKIWYAVWNQDNDIDIRLVLADYDKTIENGDLIFMATGKLSKNIEEKNKKENGIINVDNKY